MISNRRGRGAIAVKSPTYTFLKEAGLLINSGTSRSLVLSGNIHDLFFARDGEDTDYIPLVPFLTRSWDIPGFILIVYELNGPIRFAKAAEREKVKRAFNLWRGSTEAPLDTDSPAGAPRFIQQISERITPTDIDESANDFLYAERERCDRQSDVGT